MRDIWDRFVELFKNIATTVIDLAFLYLWALVVTYGHAWLEPRVVGLAGIDTVVFRFMQVVFALSTVYPVGVALYRDFAIMLKRAQAAIGRA